MQRIETGLNLCSDENRLLFRKTGKCPNSEVISLRSAFVPHSTEFVLVSADYCQLELRILAHLSEDSELLRVLNGESGICDVFTAIAAKWRNVSVQMVSLKKVCP